MQIAQLNRTNPEQVNLIITNVDGGGSITTGYGACLAVVGASIDGISAVKYAAAVNKGFCGIAIEDIAINGYGRVRAYGYVASVYISNEGTSVTVTRGDILVPTSQVAGAFSSAIANEAASTLMYKYALAGQTVTASAVQYISGVVFAL